MFRTVLTLALSMFLLAEASAQTTPATQAASAKATARTSRRVARKASRAAAKATPAPGFDSDGWPLLDNAQTAVASVAAADVAGTYDAATRADAQLVYAGPGMPVHLRTSKEPVPYSVRPARKPAAQPTTLGN